RLSPSRGHIRQPRVPLPAHEKSGYDGSQLCAYTARHIHSKWRLPDNRTRYPRPVLLNTQLRSLLRLTACCAPFFSLLSLPDTDLSDRCLISLRDLQDRSPVPRCDHGGIAGQVSCLHLWFPRLPFCSSRRHLLI